jgi:hypothetical protein
LSKKKWSGILAIFFLVQVVTSSPVLSFENSSLNPPTNIDANFSDPTVKNIYDAICLGVGLYELDTIEGLSKAEIEGRYPGLSLNSEVRFNLANMDLGRKGWTRYYPFSVGDKNFIMRIFLTVERSYQPEAPVLYEGSIANPAVTFQVLPSINEILSGCKIQPRRTYSSTEVNRSS